MSVLLEFRTLQNISLFPSTFVTSRLPSSFLFTETLKIDILVFVSCSYGNGRENPDLVDINAVRNEGIMSVMQIY